MKKFFAKNNMSLFLVYIAMIAVVVMPIVTVAQSGPGWLFTDTSYDGVNDGASGDSLTGSYSDPQTTGAGSTASAGSCDNDFDTFLEIIDYGTCVISKSLIPLLFAIALLVFFFGVVKYVIAGDGSDDREEGRWFMIYGIVGLFVMVAVWGLVAVISNTFGISTAFPPRFQ